MEEYGDFLPTDFSTLRSSLFPVETDGFSRLDVVTLLRLSRWINFLKQFLLSDMKLSRLKKTAVSDWYPKDVPLSAENDQAMLYFSEKGALKMKEAGKILTSFLFQHRKFFGIRRVKTANKDLYTYQIFPYKTSERVMDIFFNRQETFIRPAVSKT